MIPHELIRQIPLFHSLKPADMDDLSAKVRMIELKDGETLFRKGDEGTALYIVSRGAVKIVLPSRVGDEIIVTIFSDGDYFGEMALLDGKPRSADAIAISDSAIFALNRLDFLGFLQNHTDAIQAILSQLSERLRMTDEMLEDTCFLNISARLAKKLTELARTHGQKEEGFIVVDLSLTQKELGDMVGATRESINKELRLLREKGFIETDGNRIMILDMERLKRRYM